MYAFYLYECRGWLLNTHVHIYALIVIQQQTINEFIILLLILNIGLPKVVSQSFWIYENMYSEMYCYGNT